MKKNVSTSTRAILFAGLMATSIGGRPADAQTTALPTMPVRQACASDVRSLCGDVQRGGGRIKQCIVEKHDRLSDACKSAIQAARAQKQ